MRGVQLYGLTCPLLTKSDGSKMGKTETGAVWLAPERTSPYQFYQYWIRLEDADIGKALRMLTTLSRDEIESLDAARAQDAAKRDSQRRLAEELTRLVHGDEGLMQAQQASAMFFSGSESFSLPPATVEGTGVFIDAAAIKSLSRQLLAADGLLLVEALVSAGLATSKSDARRKIQQGGIYVNHQRVGDIEFRLTTTDVDSNINGVMLRSGKKNYAVLRFV
jgi:tyrosyl-tRNA synthetase